MTYQNTTLLGMLEQHVLTSPDRRAVIYEPDVFLTFTILFLPSVRPHQLQDLHISRQWVLMAQFKKDREREQ